MLGENIIELPKTFARTCRIGQSAGADLKARTVIYMNFNDLKQVRKIVELFRKLSNIFGGCHSVMFFEYTVEG